MNLQSYLNSNIYKIINNDIKNGMLNHSYILYGSGSSNVKNYSINVAQHLLCEQNGAPCGQCRICKNIENGII